MTTTVMKDGELNHAIAAGLGMKLAPSCDCHTEDGLLRNWAQSMDACLRDLVPEAMARGWWLLIMGADDGGFRVAFRGADDDCERYAIDDSACRATCLAWLGTFP